MDKKKQLQQIVKQCIISFNRGNSSDWKHSDFEDLCRAILRSTKVNISPNTLKRIFGKISIEEDYYPQLATIEALKKYCNYKETEEDDKVLNYKKLTAPNIKSSFKWIFILFILITTSFSIYLFFNHLNSKQVEGTINISKIEGQLPATVLLKTDIKNFNNDITLSFGDKSDEQKVTRKQQNIAHNYLFPGFFQVALKHKNKIIDSTNVYIQTKDWMALGFHRQRDLPNKYYAFPAEKSKKSKLFHVSNYELYKMGIDTTLSFYTRLCNYSPVKHQSNNFIFETTVKNIIHENGSYCNSVQFQISAQKGFFRFKFTNPGCSYKILNRIGKLVFDGSKMDLSDFVIPINNWNRIKLINNNKKLILSINGKKIFEKTYQEDLGEIKGLFIEFERNGFVKDCSLKSLNNRSIYTF